MLIEIKSHPFETEGNHFRDPYIELAFAVLENACDEALGHFDYSLSYQGSRKQIMERAKTWLLSDECELICEILHINIDYVRQRLSVLPEDGYLNLSLFELEENVQTIEE
jgi:hypothetical protein